RPRPAGTGRSRIGHGCVHDQRRVARDRHAEDRRQRAPAAQGVGLSPRPHTDLRGHRAGPVERDTNNGATAAGDGTAIKIRGQTFDKGLGTAAPSAVIYRLGGKCSKFTATAGVDDSTNGMGTVRFQVLADGQMLFDSMNLTGTSPAMAVDVDLAGKRRLKLLVTNADDGSAQDRASWGDAKVECDP